MTIKDIKASEVKPGDLIQTTFGFKKVDALFVDDKSFVNIKYESGSSRMPSSFPATIQS